MCPDVTDLSRSLKSVDALTVYVLTDDVSDAYVSKTLFAVSEFANVVRAGAQTISGESLLCANLGYGLRLVSRTGESQHSLMFVDQLAGLPNDEDLEREISIASGEPEPAKESKPAVPPRFTRKSSGWK